MKGFIAFVREQGVIGLAVGFILGGAVSKLVTSLIENIIQPLLGPLLGSAEGLNQLSFGSITYGNFITTLIDFVVIAAVVYFMVKGLRVDKLDRTKRK